ncbi:MAG: Na(+)-translocating NADH-quinone reductase subunit A [Nitrospirae bacterium]|nr:Na(+)-translocating NADH-quinone reductase subunit A [Nitrospirota bacterium]
MHISIKKGLHIPISGEPNQHIFEGPPVHAVALLGQDYVGLKPSMMVEEGARVKLGQPLFSDKNTPGVVFTSPGSGIVSAINRGAKRVLQSVVIQLDGEEETTFTRYPQHELPHLTRVQVTQNLVTSGLWTALRTRPYSRIPSPDSSPHSIFVTAMDSNPLAPQAHHVIKEYENDFIQGLHVIQHLTEGTVFLCKALGEDIPTLSKSKLTVAEFAGPHPSGLVGTHIHFLDPVGPKKTVWHIHYQDIIAMGKLFTTGKLWMDRIVSFAGPVVLEPRLIRTRLGAYTENLVDGQLDHVRCRVISGSLLSGHWAIGWATYLGRYHSQLTVLPEGGERRFLGWLSPGRYKFSALNIFVSSFFPNWSFRLNTLEQGSPRAIVPVGIYEDIMPMDILPTPLLKALIVKDTDMAQALGGLELDEEDLALMPLSKKFQNSKNF